MLLTNCREKQHFSILLLLHLQPDTKNVSETQTANTMSQTKYLKCKQKAVVKTEWDTLVLPGLQQTCQ